MGQVFGNYYGTSRTAIEQVLAQGRDVFLDIHWQGARRIKTQVPSVRGIFILPPSVAELERRLNQRGQDSQDVIAKRMQQAQSEISHVDEYDYVLVNDDFQQCLQDLQHCGAQSSTEFAQTATTAAGFTCQPVGELTEIA